MIKINTSPKNLPEKTYVFDIIFNEFLGLEYQLEIIPDSNYEIHLPNNKKLIFKDHFWNNFKEGSEYLNANNIPQVVLFDENDFIPEDNIPILYGEPGIIRNENEILCNIDIFASIFFFLTRWEEYVIQAKDRIGRFELTSSLSWKNNLVHRPVVNEYLEMLWKMMITLGLNEPRKKNIFSVKFTHDIDQPFRLYNFKMFAKSFAKNLIRFKNITGAISDIFIYPINKFNPKFDLANSYDFLMDLSESVGAKSTFNFQNSKITEYDWGYDINSNYIRNVFEKIKTRGHHLGFHPSYFSFDDEILWKEEYDGLCTAAGEKILSGRQHFLRFKVPFTWQTWEDNGMEADSTLGFPEIDGFRCGTCYSYSTYNFLTRKKLKLKESPLILMEKSLTDYQRLAPSVFVLRYIKLFTTVKKYKGDLVFLWHNSAFDYKIYSKKWYREFLIYTQSNY